MTSSDFHLEPCSNQSQVRFNISLRQIYFVVVVTRNASNSDVTTCGISIYSAKNSFHLQTDCVIESKQKHGIFFELSLFSPEFSWLMTADAVLLLLLRANTCPLCSKLLFGMWLKPDYLHIRLHIKGFVVLPHRNLKRPWNSCKYLPGKL